MNGVPSRPAPGSPWTPGACPRSCPWSPRRPRGAEHGGPRREGAPGQGHRVRPILRPLRAGCRVSVMTGVEVRNCARSGTSNSWTTVPTWFLLPHHDLGLVAPGRQLEVAHDREPGLVELLAGLRLELHVDLLVVAEELAGLAVGDHEQELEGVGEPAVLLLEGDGPHVDVGGMRVAPCRGGSRRRRRRSCAAGSRRARRASRPRPG